MAQREHDPVVATGADAPALIGKSPARIVAFKWDKAWQQVPVQVDERDLVGFDRIRKNSKLTFKALVYTDANTFTGPDSDPKLDADDEIAFLHKDTGGPAGFGSPKGVVAGTRTALAVTDPLTSTTRYLYLFETDGTLSPGAGKDYVTYRFVLKSGNYKMTYNTRSGPNLEDSFAKTSRYEVRFSDRWIHDVTKILVGQSTGVDILDRHKFQFQPGNCNRTTSTFSLGGGAMIANIDGPVRGIRSVVGANSGSMTQRDWLFYEGRMDVVTHLRVHAIAAMWHFYDHSPAASGMRYYDNLNLAGFLVDGKPDAAQTGILDWQLVTGAQGSVTRAFQFDTDIRQLKQLSYYFDDASPSWNQCTGDAFAYAASGPATGGMPNTDPLRGPANRYVATNTSYFDGPGLTTQNAIAQVKLAQNPLVVRGVPGFRTFGSGCKGSRGVPTLVLAGAPEIGESITYRVAPLDPNTAGLLFFGVSDKLWNGLTLPLDLSVLAMPGCSLYVSPDLAVALAHTGGAAQVTMAIPNDRALVGRVLFNQYLAADAAANKTGLHVSNAGRLEISG